MSFYGYVDKLQNPDFLIINLLFSSSIEQMHLIFQYVITQNNLVLTLIFSFSWSGIAVKPLGLDIPGEKSEEIPPSSLFSSHVQVS